METPARKKKRDAFPQLSLRNISRFPILWIMNRGILNIAKYCKSHYAILRMALFYKYVDTSKINPPGQRHIESLANSKYDEPYIYAIFKERYSGYRKSPFGECAAAGKSSHPNR